MKLLVAAALALGLGACSTPEPGPTPASSGATPGGTASSEAPGRFRLGAARVKITPTKFGWMTGYGNRNKPADGVKAELWARALAIEDEAGHRAVLVTADILGFPPQFSQTLRALAVERFGLEPSAVLFIASHTHGGPAVPERPSMEIFHGLDEKTGQDVFEYADWLQDRILEAMSKALVARRPGKLYLSHASAHFGMNRRFHNPNGTWSIKENPEGLVDPDVVVVRAQGEDDQPIATVFTYACHGTTLGGDIYEYHGDWSGEACQAIEAATDGAPALFATGCGGDLNPSPRGKYEMAVAHGQAMAAAVLGSGRGAALSGPLRTDWTRIDLPLGPAPSRDLLEKGLTDKNVFRRRHSAEMLKLLEGGRLPASVSYPIEVWHFGSETLVALAGETCVGYALRLKRELGPDHTWVVGYANEVPCYIPTEAVLAEGGYEPGWDPPAGPAIAAGSMMFYGWPVPFAPGVEDRIISAAVALARR